MFSDLRAGFDSTPSTIFRNSKLCSQRRTLKILPWEATLGQKRTPGYLLFKLEILALPNQNAKARAKSKRLHVIIHQPIFNLSYAESYRHPGGNRRFHASLDSKLRRLNRIRTASRKNGSSDIWNNYLSSHHRDFFGIGKTGFQIVRRIDFDPENIYRRADVFHILFPNGDEAEWPMIIELLYDRL